MSAEPLYMKTVTPGGRVRYEPTAVPDYDGLGAGAYLLVVEEQAG